MASRTVHGDVVTAITSGEVRLAWLVDLVLDAGELNIWTGIGSLSANGNTYQGAGDLGSVEAIEENTDLKATGLRLSLSGVTSSLVSAALSEQYQGRTCRAYVGFFDSSWVILGDPLLLFGGRIDVMQITDSGKTSEISLTAESRAVDLERPGEVRYYTDEDQQRLFSGDRGCEGTAALVDAHLSWGRVDVVQNG